MAIHPHCKLINPIWRPTSKMGGGPVEVWGVLTLILHHSNIGKESQKNVLRF